MFVFLDNRILQLERDFLRNRYVNSVVFDSHINDSTNNFDTIFKYLQENQQSGISQRTKSVSIN